MPEKQAQLRQSVSAFDAEFRERRRFRERRLRLQKTLRARGAATTRELADALGWPSTEVRDKLASLRDMGRAEYDPTTRDWWAS